MFELPPHARPSEWITAFVLVVATAGAAVRFSGAYSPRVAAGIVALLFVVDALLVWAAFRNHSIRRQRALGREYASKYRE